MEEVIVFNLAAKNIKISETISLIFGSPGIRLSCFYL